MTYIFRCPDEDMELIENLCDVNEVDCSMVLVTALILYTDRQAEAGHVEVLPEPPRQMKSYEPAGWLRSLLVSDSDLDTPA